MWPEAAFVLENIHAFVHEQLYIFLLYLYYYFFLNVTQVYFSLTFTEQYAPDLCFILIS